MSRLFFSFFIAVFFTVGLFAGGELKAQILVEDPVRQSSSVPSQTKIDESRLGDTSESAEQKPQVGRNAAAKYFKKREQSGEFKSSHGENRMPNSVGSDRVLMLHFGTFINDKAYRWGRQPRVDDPGQSMLGVTYRIGEWKSSMDLYIRADMISYKVDNERPLKLSVMPIIAFPDARSEFPLYFGAGMGAGVFFRQVGDESDISLDYALLVGARFPELFNSAGVFVETGLKGQVHILSNGQQDGVFLAAGAIFNF